jgi:hypothetical protein
MPDLRIHFPKPGFFIADVRLQILLDGQPVYDGSFKSGADVTVAVAPGSHQIESRIELSPIVRTRRWDLAVDQAPATATLEYSRFWGNFKKRLSSD